MFLRTPMEASLLQSSRHLLSSQKPIQPLREEQPYDYTESSWHLKMQFYFDICHYELNAGTHTSNTKRRPPDVVGLLLPLSPTTGYWEVQSNSISTLSIEPAGDSHNTRISDKVPVEVHQASSSLAFRKSIKTYLFREAVLDLIRVQLPFILLILMCCFF